MLTVFWVLLPSCETEISDKSEKQKEAVSEDRIAHLDTIHLALDWSPNVLHSGIFYADHTGLLEENGIYLDWFTTEIDGYKKKPIQRLIDREVDLAVAPSEHLFFYGDTAKQEYAVALATILQKGQSAFVVKSRNKIKTPKDMEGQTYIGYKTPLEEEILSEMIENDGGEPVFNSIAPPRLSVWNSFLDNKGDIAWIFSHWEGAKAKAQGIELNYFYPNDFGVPYGYTSVIMANKKRDSQQNDKIIRFLQTLEIAHKQLLELDAKEVVDFLSSYSDHDNFQNSKVVEIAWIDIKDAFTDQSAKWGRMSDSVWVDYYQWIRKHDVHHFNHEIEDVSIYYEHILSND
jgi:ABC-type nitrate/sulfonate/bicarbonate transport system substrate-binding protein